MTAESKRLLEGVVAEMKPRETKELDTVEEGMNESELESGMVKVFGARRRAIAEQIEKISQKM